MWISGIHADALYVKTFSIQLRRMIVVTVGLIVSKLIV